MADEKYLNVKHIMQVRGKRIEELEKEVEHHKNTIRTLLNRLNPAEKEVLESRFEIAQLRKEVDNWQQKNTHNTLEFLDEIERLREEVKRLKGGDR